MGFLWDVIQQSQIHNMSRDRDDLYARVSDLEGEVQRLQGMVEALVRALEKKFGEDIDGDGRVG